MKKLITFCLALTSVMMVKAKVLPLNWDNVNPSYVYSCSRPTYTEYKALKYMKAACDTRYLYIRAAFDTQYIDINEDLGDDYFRGHPGVPFHVFLNNGTNNGYKEMWTTPSMIFAEGFLFESGRPASAYSPYTFKWAGDEPSGAWLWNEISSQIVTESIVTDSTVEMQISLATLPFTCNEYVHVGVDIYKAWSNVGLLPRGEDREYPADGVFIPGVTEMAKVRISPTAINTAVIINHLGYAVNENTKIASVVYCDKDVTSIEIPNTIEFEGKTYSVTTIGDEAFYGCSGLTSITIPNFVTTIGRYAFYGCSSLTKVEINSDPYLSQDFSSKYEQRPSNVFGSQVIEYVIGNSVKTIGGHAFHECKGLTSITIPNSVTTIGSWAFVRCDGLTSINVDASNTHFSSVDGVLLNYAKDTLIQYPIGNTRTEYVIPHSVTTIGNYAFSDCSGLRLVTIPHSVTTIREFAFAECNHLTSVTCYAQNPPVCGSNCFYDVPKDIPLYIPYVSLDAYKSAAGWKDFTNIITRHFDICGKDLHWKYETGTLSISGTGDMCDFVQTDSPWLDLKDSVTSIVFPSNITSIGKYAFYGFSKLTFITIPNSVTTIGESAFKNCTYLKTITLGKSITDIGCGAFKGDSRVEEITSYAEVTPNVCSSTFDGLSKQYIYLYVPENSIRGYQVDPNWNGFDIRTKSADKKPIDGENPVVTPTDQDVTITWPITDGTDTYTLTITKNGEVVCVLTFNANGQLTNIAFAAPGHNGARQAPAATLTAQGYQFTVTGLNPGTAYDYSVTATDAGGKTLAEHKGNFNTTGGTGFESVHDAQATMHKVLRNGQLLIETHNATYTPLGQKVK